MVATLKIVIGVIIVAVCVTALVVGIVLGTRNYDSCDTAAAPTNLVFTQNANYGVVVSWTDNEKSEDCEVTYMFSYQVDGVSPAGSQVNTTALTRTIADLEPCATLRVHIYSIGDSGEPSEDHLMDDYVVTPNRDILTTTDVVFSTADDDLNMEWTVPDSLSKCENLTYQISVETDRNAVDSAIVTTESHAISYDSFCLEAVISITTVYGTIAGEPVEWPFSDSSELLNIEIAEGVEGSNELRATWTDHPKAEECSLSYTAFRRIGEADTPLIREDGALAVSFPYEFCEVASIVVIIHKEDETVEVVEDATQYPTSDEIGAVDSVSIERESVEGGLVLSWIEKTIAQCAITYEIEFITDLTDVVKEYATAELSYEVPDNIYCYNLGANVYAVINADSEDRRVGPAGEIGSLGYQMSSVEDLAVSVVAEGLSVTWAEHPKKELCSLEYRVEYSYDAGTISDAEETAETELIVEILMENCVEAEVSVEVFNRENDEWVATAAEQTATAWPETLGSVSNIAFNPVTGLITWTAVSSTGRCTDIQYRLDFTSDDGSTDTQTVTTTSSTIPADITFCFSLIIKITAILGTLEGPPVTYVYDENVMSAVSGLRYAVSPTGQLEVEWTRHAKEASCSLQYRYAYTLAGQPLVTDDIDSNSITLDYVYCTAATLSVQVTDASGNLGATTSIEINTGPQATYVADLTVTVSKEDDNTEGTVSWAEIVFGACSVTYDVTVTTATPVDYKDVTSPFTFPIGDYCLTLQASVTPIVNGISLTPIMSNTEDFVMSAVADVDYTISPTGQLEVEWTRHTKEASCSLQYRITYTATGQTEIVQDTNSDSSDFDYFYCADATVSVQTIDASNNLGTANTIPINAEGPVASYVATSTVTVAQDNGDNTAGTVTWTDVVIGACSVTYNVAVITESTANYPAVTSPYDFQFEDYCFTAQARVTPVVNGIELTPIESDSITLEIGSVGVVTPDISSNEMTVSWAEHPKQQECGLSYQVIYSINDELQGEIPVTTPEAQFDYVYCAAGLVTVIPVKDAYEGAQATVNIPYGEPQSSADISQRISSVTLKSVDNELTAEWSEVEIGRCLVQYDIEITSLPLVIPYPDVQSPYVLNDMDYCYSVRVGVAPGVGDVIGTYTYQQGSHSIVFEDPQDFQLVPTHAETLTASWTAHEKAVRCGISYEVSYSYGTTGPVSYPATGNSVELPIAYCTTARATLTATLTSSGATTTSVDEYTAGNPASVEVSNIQLDVDEVAGTATVSWDVPDYVSECTDIEYAVTAESEDGSQKDPQTCLITDTCTVTLSDFCSAKITVQATSVSGQEDLYVHECP